MRFYPLLPYLLILFSAVLVFCTVYFVGTRGYRKQILMILRFCSVGLLLVMLLCPGMLTRETDRSRSNLIFLLDGSASMSTADMPGKTTRFESAREALKQLMNDSFDGSRKYIYVFNHRAVPADSLAETELYSPFGNTDLKQAVDVADRDLGIASAGGVVILSDGLDHSKFSGVPAGVPVFAVKTGTNLERVSDLGIDSFPVPHSVRTGEELELAVPVTLRGVPEPKNIELTVFADQEKIKQETLELQPGKTVKIPIKISFATPGLHLIQMKLNRLPVEASYINNTREILVEVQEDNISPVLYFPVLTNTYRPLTRLFRQTGRKYTAVYRVRDGVYQIQGTSPESVYDRGIPKNPEAMKRTDLLFLASGNAEHYSDAEVRAMEQYVSSGGSILIYGGPDAFGPAKNKQFSAMLPVRSAKSQFADSVFSLKQSGNPLFEDLVKQSASVEGLNLIDRVKSGAEVLLSAQGDKTYPLVVSMPYGRGKVIAVLTNSLHRLGTPEKRAARFRMFWENLLVHAGEDRNEKLRISVVSDHIASGGSLAVSAVAPTALSAEASLTPFGGKTPRFTRKMKKQETLFTCAFPDIPAGKYVLRVTAADSNSAQTNRYRMIYSGDSAAENDDLKVSDEKFMRFTTHGRVYLPDETARLRDDMRAVLRKNQVEHEWYPVFETPFFFLILFLLLMTEWFLRRKYNMF